MQIESSLRSFLAAFVFVAVFGIAGVGNAAEPVEVVACSQVMEGDAYLSGDLDCSGAAYSPFVVELGDGGTLDMRGFTLTGAPGDDVVRCRYDCVINGPGTIAATARGHGISGLKWSGRRRDEIVVQGINVVGGENGIIGRRLVVYDSVITGANSSGAAARRIVAERSFFTNNRYVGIYSRESRRPIVLRDCVVTGNGFAGVNAQRTRIYDSEVVGNGVDPSCGRAICADIASRILPRLRRTVCDTSLRLHRNDCTLGSNSPPWCEFNSFGVCALD